MKRWAVCLCALLIAGCSTGEEYPNRPITIICPWSVGGGTDRVSRQLSVYLEHELGVPVNVINATGGRGVTGHSRGLRARPDGYTIAMMTVELSMLHWQDLTEISWKDARPLMSVNEDAAALFVQNEAPWENLDELVADIRERPGELTASGTANGGIWHLALAGWLESMDMSATDVNWIPMNGAGPSLQELVSGGVDIVCCSLPEGRTLYRSGQVRCLGVMAEEPVPGYEEVPTLKAQGYDWTMVGWRGLAVPRGTPQKRVDLLVETLKKIVTGKSQVQGRTFPEFMAAEGFNNRWRPPDEFRQFLKENDKKFGKLLKSEAFSTISSRGIGPMAFPGLIFAVIVVLLFSLGVQGLRGKTSSDSTMIQGIDDETGQASFSTRGLVNSLLLIAAVVAYLLLAEELGFLLTAGSILFLSLWRLGTRLWVSALVTLLLVPGIYYLFAQLLRVPLPPGILG